MAKADDDKDIDWKQGFGAGMFVIGLAALIQFALGELGTDDVANLPWYVGAIYESAGKMGLTVPLAVVGLGLVLWNLRLRTRSGGVARTSKAETSAAPAEKPAGKVAYTGQPIRGKGFPGKGGTSASHAPPSYPPLPGEPDRPPPEGGSREAAPGGNGGRVVLSTEKYLSRETRLGANRRNDQQS